MCKYIFDLPCFFLFCEKTKEPIGSDNSEDIVIPKETETMKR